MKKVPKIESFLIAYIYDIFKTYRKTYLKQFNNIDMYMI